MSKLGATVDAICSQLVGQASRAAQNEELAWRSSGHQVRRQASADLQWEARGARHGATHNMSCSHLMGALPNSCSTK